MPKFLNNIDLNGNQLVSPVIHVSSQSTITNGPAGNTTGTEGQIFYNSHANGKALFFRDNSAWRPIGDISGVTAGVGLSGGGTGGTVTLTVDFSEFSDVTPVNGDKLATLDSDGSTEQLTTIASLATLFAGSGLTATNSVIAVDTLNQSTSGNAATATKLASAVNIGGVSFDGSAAITLVSGSIPNNAADTSGTAATVTTNANLTGHITSSGNAAVLGSFTVAQLSTALSNASISGNNTGDQTNVSGTSLTVTQAAQTAITSVGTLTGLTVSGNINANGSIIGDDGTSITNIDTISLDKVEADGTTINIGNQASKTVFLGKAESSSGAADGTGVTIREHLSVLGDITIAGGVTLESTNNTAVKDTNLVMNSGFSAESLNDKEIGFIFERGSGTNVGFRWDETNDTFDLIATPNAGNEAAGTFAVQNSSGGANEFLHAVGSAATGWQNLKINKLTAPGGVVANVTGNASGSSATVSSIGNLTGDVTSSNRATTIASGAVHHAMLAEDYISGQTSITALTQTDLLAVHDTSATEVKQISLTNFEDQIFSNINAASSHIAIAAGGAITVNTLNQNTTGTAGSISGITNANIVQKVETQTLTNKTLTSPVLNTGVSGTAIKDEDDLTSNSASHLATQQSIKAYVDAQTSGDSNTGGRQPFVLNNSVDGVAVSNSNKTYTVTHGMGSSFNYGVEVIRNANNSGGGETVYTDVTRTNTTVVINFAVAPTAGNFTALVCKY